MTGLLRIIGISSQKAFTWLAQKTVQVWLLPSGPDHNVIQKEHTLLLKELNPFVLNGRETLWNNNKGRRSPSSFKVDHLLWKVNDSWWSGSSGTAAALQVWGHELKAMSSNSSTAKKKEIGNPQHTHIHRVKDRTGLALLDSQITMNQWLLCCPF
jgi:hypothetical protein